MCVMNEAGHGRSAWGCQRDVTRVVSASGVKNDRPYSVRMEISPDGQHTFPVAREGIAVMKEDAPVHMSKPFDLIAETLGTNEVDNIPRLLEEEDL